MMGELGTAWFFWIIIIGVIIWGIIQLTNKSQLLNNSETENTFRYFK